MTIAVALSGITTALMPDGRMAHSSFKISIAVKENGLGNIGKNSKMANLFQHTRLIVYPMFRRETLRSC